MRSITNCVIGLIFFGICGIADESVKGKNLAGNPGVEEWGPKTASGHDWGAKKFSVKTPGRG